MKLGMVSLGCPKNLVDSEVMLGIIRVALRSCFIIIAHQIKPVRNDDKK